MASNLAHYYTATNLNSSSSVFNPAQAAFDRSRDTFEQIPTRRSSKRRHNLEGTTLEDVLDAVVTAKKRYENEHIESKTRRCIVELSKRICYYDNVMDVLVQHHPEYVALAWGAMKFVFGAVIEHENIGRTIVIGLCDVADALPRVEIATSLYPIDAIQHAVSVLYAHIMEFLLRALDWFEEGKIAHAIHSITRPAALRYDDLLHDIRRSTRKIADLGVACSQAEQRDMHTEQRDILAKQGDMHVEQAGMHAEQRDMRLEQRYMHTEQKEMHHELGALTTLVQDFMKQVLLDQSLKASALLECRHALSEISMAQAFSSISLACNIDYKSDFQLSLRVRDKNRFVPSRSKCQPFWTSSEMYAWNGSQNSSSIIIRASFRSRFYTRDFCINVIEQLRKANIAVLWVLKPKERTLYSVVEVLQSLIYQSLTLNPTSRIDAKLSFQLHEFLNAHIESDYINLLERSLKNLRHVYILVEAGAMDPSGATQCLKHLQELSTRLSEHDAATIIKIMLLSYGPEIKLPLNKHGTLLRVGKVSHRKGKKLPMEPIQSLVDHEPTQTRRPLRGSMVPLRMRGRAIRAAGD